MGYRRKRRKAYKGKRYRRVGKAWKAGKGTISAFRAGDGCANVWGQ